MALLLGLASALTLIAACNAILGYEEGEVEISAAGGAGGSAPTGGAGAVGGSGAQGAAVGDENCLNGIDDNGDQLADCADPLCVGAGFACLERSAGQPPGFAKSRLATSPGESCPAGFTQQTLYEGLTYDPLTCTCGCDDPSGANCTMSGSVYEGASCTGTSIDLHAGCNVVTGYDSYQGTVTMNSPGSCVPTAESSGVPATSWSTAYDLCVAESAGAGCDTGSVCAPPPPPGFSPEACIVLADATPCALPYEQVATLGSSAIVDERQCTTDGCNCSPAVSQSCSGRAGPTLYDTCPDFWTPYSVGPCRSTSGATYIYVEHPESDGGYCTPSGSGAAQGSVHAAEQYSLCCVP